MGREDRLQLARHAGQQHDGAAAGVEELCGTLINLGLGMIGWLADRGFGTRPRWLLVGLLVGGVVGFYRLGRAMLTRR